MSMKAIASVLVIALASFAAAQSPKTAKGAAGAPPAQSTAAAANPNDVKSLDAIMRAVYDVISGPAGEKRDWARFRSLFVDGARLIPTRPNRDGSGWGTAVMSPDDYASRAQGYFDREAFYESEIARRTERWGHIAQVFSTYASKRSASGPAFEKGINSFQLFYDGHRWWIVTIYWEGESKDVPLPPEFLRSPK